MNKKILILILSSLLLLGLASAVPVSPHWFYGTVVIGAYNAPVDSIITATIGGETKGSTTVTTTGVYGDVTRLTVTGATEGQQTITFTISNVGSCSLTDAITTATFVSGKLEEKNLAFSGTCAAPGQGPAAAGGAGGAAGAGAAGAAAKVTETLVTDPSVISDVKQSLPTDWTNVEIYQYGDPTSKAMETSSDTIDNALTYSTQTDAISELQTLKTDIQSGETTAVPTTTTLQVYHTKNVDTGDWTYTTGVTITATAPDNLENVEIIEVIPASVASLEEIVFLGEQPEILQSENGIVAKWTIDSMDKGQSIELKYFIKKKVTSINTMTLAGGKVVEEIAPPITPTPPEKAIPWVGIIIIVAIIVIGLIVYYVSIKKKKE